MGRISDSTSDAHDFLRDPASWPGDGDDFVFNPPGSGGYMGPDEWPAWTDRDRWTLTGSDAAAARKAVACA